MTVTLIEAHSRFADKLDELRRRHVVEFDVWLKSALDRNLAAAQKTTRDRLAIERKTFVDEFLDQHAPIIVHELNPGAERDIVRALKSYEARPEPARSPAATTERRWLPSLWRTALAAAFGAVVSVILLALQPIGDATMARDTVVRWLLAAAFVSALGAAIGVFIVACPPLSSLLERFGLKGTALHWAKGFGGAFLLFRIGPVIVLVAALLSGFFALIAWLLGGSKPLHVLIGIAALAVVLAARWTAPDASAQDRNAIHRALVAQLDRDLRSDANVWAALSAALVVRLVVTPPPPAEIGEIVNIIVSREKNADPPPRILQVVKQRLGIGTVDGADSAQWPSEFVWKAEHEDTFDTFGIVEVGDVVTVSTQPNVVVRPNGSRQVTQKGLVTRKSEGS